jgi:FkbM family methyltransferase
MEFEKLRNKIIKKPNAMIKCLEQMKSDGLPVILYGAGQCGMEYVEILRRYKIKILYFCDDDKNKYGKKILGINIISLDDVKKIRDDYKILISSYGPLKLLPKLTSAGLDKKFIFTEFYLFENGLDYYKFYISKIKYLTSVYDLLADEKSKEVFINLLNYKISRDINLIREINNGEVNQYFDSDIIEFCDGETFVDLGAYTGDTILKFINNIKKHKCKYRQIFAFEPDKNTYSKLKENTIGYNDIKCFEVGAYSKEDILKFNGESFWTSSIDKQGDTEIKVNAVDNIIKESVTFIKADIEGAEIQAIEGLRNIIQLYKPKIAFAMYHRKDDIFKIPIILHEMNKDYRFYMRQYSDVSLESVLYAINNERK